MYTCYIGQISPGSAPSSFDSQTTTKYVKSFSFNNYHKLCGIYAEILLTAFPAPIVFGLVIDTTCLVLQGCGGSRKGACLLYDNDLFRWRLHGFSFAVKAVACFIYVIATFMSKGIEYQKQFYESDINSNDKEMVVKNDIYKNRTENKNIGQNGNAEDFAESDQLAA